MVGHIHLNKKYLNNYSFKSKHKMLFNTLMMVIVYIYKRIFTLNARHQGRLLLCHKFTFLTHLYNLCTTELAFPNFPSLD
jgi:hypothetical protein